MVDNGLDQSTINTNLFVDQSFTSKYTNIGGALSTMNSLNLELVNEACILTILDNGKKTILKINQALLNLSNTQSKALLQLHHIRAFDVVADDCATRHIALNGAHGAQSIVADNTRIPLNFDGWNCYIHIRKPTPTDLFAYEVVELKSSLAYTFQ